MNPNQREEFAKNISARSGVAVSDIVDVLLVLDRMDFILIPAKERRMGWWRLTKAMLMLSVLHRINPAKAESVFRDLHWHYPYLERPWA